MHQSESGRGEPDHWKSKYLDFLDEHELLEQQLTDRIALLRKGLVRVSLAAQGVNVDLDPLLDDLRRLLRGDENIGALTLLLEKIETLVLQLDQHKQQGKNLSTMQALVEGLSKTDLASEQLQSLKSLRQQLSQVKTETDWLLDFAQLQQQVLLHQHEQKPPSLLDRVMAPKKPQDADFLALEGIDDADVLLQRIQDILLGVMQNISVDTNLRERHQTLLETLESPLHLHSLVPVIDSAAHFIMFALNAKNIEFHAYLESLNGKLGELQKVVGSSQHQGEQITKHRALAKQQLQTSVDGIHSAIETADDLEDLKISVKDQLESLLKGVNEQEQESQQWQGRMEKNLHLLVQKISFMEQDSAQVHEYLQEQRDKACKDALTLLPNRLAYQERMSDELNRLQRYQGKLCLAVVDVDFFKKVNDQFGHLAGDRVLKALAQELQRRVRKADFVARYGGEEFVVVMPQTDAKAALVALDKIRESVANGNFQYKKQRLPVTVSIGISEFAEGEDEETVFARADKALYQAKDQGRNCCRIFGQD